MDTFQSPGFYIPFSINPFNGFLTGIMKRLREQMSSILSRIPESGIVSPWGKIPEGANTTSTTKIVDGHVVTINETTYSSGNDSHGAVFRVRIIDVKPQNDTLETVGGEGEAEVVTTESSESESTTAQTEDSSTPARSVETVENDLNNEIPKSQIELLNA
ncbi:icarapin-like [Cephus cinctus]|uniref:Icarapin-like n=1 Tax=Cephus cinctus TaxID=211228 RepID=A0AAJ7RML1_CEPCN|nr:icarapin-like [Cephus cinctus]